MGLDTEIGNAGYLNIIIRFNVKCHNFRLVIRSKDKTETCPIHLMMWSSMNMEILLVQHYIIFWFSVLDILLFDATLY